MKFNVILYTRTNGTFTLPDVVTDIVTVSDLLDHINEGIRKAKNSGGNFIAIFYGGKSSMFVEASEIMAVQAIDATPEPPIENVGLQA